MSGSKVDQNQSSQNDVGIGLYGSNVTSNLIEKNTANSNGTGISVGSAGQHATT